MNKTRHAIITKRSAPTHVPYPEFDWNANNMEMRYIECPNHPGMKYLTKDPRCRHLHVIAFPTGTWEECPCPLSAMMVRVVDED